MAKTIRSPRQLRLQEIMRETRKAHGLTQATLAQRLGKPQSFVAKYESGERRLDIVELIVVSAQIGCDPRAIVAELMTVPDASDSSS